MAEDKSWLFQVLDDYSTDRFHTLRGGYKYNHMSHGIIALWRLGADEGKVRTFAETYSQCLEPAKLGPNGALPPRELLGEKDLKDLLGKRVDYLRLVGHFIQRLADLDHDLDLFINEEFPALANSLASGALHGIITMGYAYVIHHERLLCEGLAFLHMSYVPHITSPTTDLTTCLGTGSQDILDVLCDIWKDGRLLAYVTENPIIFNDDRDACGFVVRIHTVLTKKGDEILDLVGKVKMPDYFSKKNMDPKQLKSIGEWLTDSAILVYGLSERVNDFFLLHGVTGAWGLAQVLPCITDTNQALTIISHFLATLIAAYIAELCPALEEANLLGVEAVGWGDLRRRTMELAFDEHIYKVVHICEERYVGSGEERMRDVYLRTAQLAADCPLMTVEREASQRQLKQREASSHD